MKDLFSHNSKNYALYRPTYPLSLYEEVLRQVKKKERCWDCGTGNGQAAAVLARHFQEVVATDISNKQLDAARAVHNIKFNQVSAEKTNIPSASFDLITVAQAVHWFDIAGFDQEAMRTLKKDGVLAIWGYDLLRTESLNDVVGELYFETLKGCWPEERRHVETHYSEIDFPLQKLETREHHIMKYEWSASQLLGYFRTWSAVREFKKRNAGADPLINMEKTIKKRLEGASEHIEFPIFLKMWRKTIR